MPHEEMTTPPMAASTRILFQCVIVALILVLLGRLALVVPDWMRGTPPVYPDQYLSRLYSAMVGVPLMGVTFLTVSALADTRPAPRWRTLLQWALLAVSVVAMALDMYREL